MIEYILAGAVVVIGLLIIIKYEDIVCRIIRWMGTKKERK